MAASPGGIEVGRISLRVVPDTSHLGADLKVALDRIEAQTDLRISTSIDTTDLDIQARAAVDQAQAAAGNIHIKTEVDTSQIHEAESALAGASSAASGFSSSLGGVGIAAAILGPALIPLGASLAALVATLVAPLAIVGGGLTLFGVLAGFTISETQKQLTAITAAQKKLDGLTKGTAAYASAAADLRAKQAALTPAQVAFQGALSKLKNAFDQIPKSIILKPIIDGLNLLADVLPLIKPILKTVSGFLIDMLGDLDKAARSKGFKDFISAFAKQLGPDLRAFATIAGNVFQGLFGLFGAFNDQLSGDVLKSLENLTGQFATFGQTLGQSKGFKAFVDYVKRVGPKVADIIGTIAGDLGAIVVAAAPIGTVVLDAIDGIAHAVGKIPVPVLTALVVFLGAVAGLGVSPEIAAIAAAFVLLYQNSKPLRRTLGDLRDFFKTQLLPVIKDAAQNIIPQLKKAFHDVSKTIKDNQGFIETVGKLLLVFGSAAVVGGIYALIAAIRIAGKAIQFQITFWHRFADVVLLAIGFIIRAVGFMLGAFLTAFGTIIHAAAVAFGWVPGLGGRLKSADASFHQFTDSVVNNLNHAADNVDNFRHHLDAALTPPKPIKITVDDLKAIKDLQALQAFRFRDKNVNVTTTFLERAVGPGGGLGHPSTNSGNNIFAPVPAPANASPRSAGTTPGHGGSGGDTFNIEAHDYNDFLRQLQSRRRGRSGGGVLLDRAGVR